MKIDKSVFLEPFCFLERCQLSTHDTLLASCCEKTKNGSGSQMSERHRCRRWRTGRTTQANPRARVRRKPQAASF
jgi:hypothetical protein